MTDRAALLVEHLNLPEASGVDDAVWESFQLRHLNDDSQFRHEVKSRQIAWSFLTAAEGIADAVLEAQGSLYVSINLDEAKEKIRYAKRVYENLEFIALPKLVRDNELTLEFDNGARLMSLPAKPPRGKARMNVYLDEFAHVQHDKAIYTAALPIISKGGRLRVGSSPLGASGVFWEIGEQKLRAYPGYARKSTPWWEVRAFCTDVKRAKHEAPAMETAERVAAFGRLPIQAIYANMPLEDFQQEYEASYVDESTAWITWDEIRANQDSSLACHLATAKGKDISPAFAAIDKLAAAIKAGHAEASLGAGVDIGRTKNTTELAIGGKSTTDTYPLRALITLDGMEFDDQLEVLSYAITTLPITKMLIDKNGLGMNLAENMHKKFKPKAEGVDFTNGSKQVWATDAKMLIQQGKTPIPVDRDLSYQIHSIKKTVTPSKNNVFDTDRNEKHHADKFWAWALMLAAVRVAIPVRPPAATTTVTRYAR